MRKRRKHTKNFAALVGDAIPQQARGKPIELWWQMLCRRTLPGLAVQTGRRLQSDRSAAAMSSNESTIHIAIELSTSSWLVATRLPGIAKSRMHRIDVGDTTALLTLVDGLRARSSNGPGQVADLACCFEAGRDGFWLHRLLTQHGVPTYVVEPTSILVNRRARRAKTDRLDAEGLQHVLAAHVGGDRQVCSMVRVPTPEEEDAKRPHREREHLVQERTRFENRILALLATQGIRERPSLRTWERDLNALRTSSWPAMSV
jgi:transposase